MLLKRSGMHKKLTKIFIMISYGIVTQTMAAVFTPTDISLLKERFLNNITPQGAVMASPSKVDPDYYYDWVRDAAISMGLIEKWYALEKKPEDKARLINYVYWVQKVQHQVNPNIGQDILGEPKFYLDGRPFDGQWGRPQNDGPALRALTLIRFAKTLLKENEQTFVEQHLYGNSLDPNTMGAIKMDLEYVAHHWQEKNYDLWEEVYGDHFFTAVVQRIALLEGAELADQLQDRSAAAYYRLQAGHVKTRLKQHINKETGYVDATLAPHLGPQKSFELDSAVILASLLSYEHDDSFPPDNAIVKKTVLALKEQFSTLYPINKKHHGAVLFGRYPGDTYDGHRGDGLGNPWFILTATMAEYHYTLADIQRKNNANKKEVEKQIHQGDAYLKLIKTYAPDLHLSEQINLESGKQQGAASLTWSYVAVLRAIEARVNAHKSAVS